MSLQYVGGRDGTMVKFSAMLGYNLPPPPGYNRVKVSENLGATTIALVALAVTSLLKSSMYVCNIIYLSIYQKAAMNYILLIITQTNRHSKELFYVTWKTP